MSDSGVRGESTLLALGAFAAPPPAVGAAELGGLCARLGGALVLPEHRQDAPELPAPKPDNSARMSFSRPSARM